MGNDNNDDKKTTAMGGGLTTSLATERACNVDTAGKQGNARRHGILLFYNSLNLKITADPLFPRDGQTTPKQAHALANTTKVA